MEITKKIKLGNNYYYIVVDLEYKKHEEGFAVLCLKEYSDNYWDSGNWSLLIDKIEKSYNLNDIKKYNINNQYMMDVIYIYERIPFISGIKEICISTKDNVVSFESYISKDEIEDYIENFNIQVTSNPNFKLMDERTWKV